MNFLKPLLSKRIGQAKEQEAAHWLKQQGIKIITHNHHCKGGEIDLIGESKQPLTLVFFEIKYRKSDQYGHASEMLTTAQQRRIRRCAEHYLQTHPEFKQHWIRFDLVSWQGTEQKQWLKNAF